MTDFKNNPGDNVREQKNWLYQHENDLIDDFCSAGWVSALLSINYLSEVYKKREQKVNFLCAVFDAKKA